MSARFTAICDAMRAHREGCPGLLGDLVMHPDDAREFGGRIRGLQIQTREAIPRGHFQLSCTRLDHDHELPDPDVEDDVDPDVSVLARYSGKCPLCEFYFQRGEDVIVRINGGGFAHKDCAIELGYIEERAAA